MFWLLLCLALIAGAYIAWELFWVGVALIKWGSATNGGRTFFLVLLLATVAFALTPLALNQQLAFNLLH